MARSAYVALVSLAAVCSLSFAAYVEAVASVLDLSSGHVEPRIALHCGHKAQYIDTKSGTWVTDQTDEVGGCVESLSRDEIVNICKRVYSKREVTNYVEGNTEVPIDSWCSITGDDKCDQSFSVTPIRCLIGQFESDALLVPKKCKFEHIHRDQTCLSPKQLWAMASEDCNRQRMDLHDIGVLLPCKNDFDRFEGVEFVCCPSAKPRTEAPSTTSNNMETSFSTATSAPSEEPVLDDIYFKQKPIDNKEEHDLYEAARHRLQDKQDARLSRVMQQWQEAQRQYENLKKKDPQGANVMQEAMLSIILQKDKERSSRSQYHRFDETMASLEIDAQREHEQLRVTHQQRIESSLLERRTKTQQGYADTLRAMVPKAKKILHALQRHLKAIQKDRQHRISHFKHMREVDPEGADHMKQPLLQALRDMDANVQECVDMLRKLPDIYAQLQGKLDELLMDTETAQDSDFMQTLAAMVAEDPTEPEQPATDPVPEPTATEKVLEPSTTLVMEPKETKEPVQTVPVIAVKPLDRYYENEIDQPVEELPTPLQQILAQKIMPAEPIAVSVSTKKEKPKPKPAAMKMEGLHRNNPKTFKEGQVKQVAISPNSTPAVAFGLACGVLAVATVVVVAVVIVRKKTRRTPVNQGFAEIDPNMTVEQRHIASMQASGYENPTYKYFEMQ